MSYDKENRVWKHNSDTKCRRSTVQSVGNIINGRDPQTYCSDDLQIRPIKAVVLALMPGSSAFLSLRGYSKIHTRPDGADRLLHRSPDPTGENPSPTPWIFMSLLLSHPTTLAQIHYKLSYRQAKFPRILSQNGQNKLEGQGQWSPFSILVENIPWCMFGANLVILAKICDELSCRQGKVYGQTQATTIPLRPERSKGKNLNSSIANSLQCSLL